MTDYFDFPALPAVIQDLIVEEIVHNSVPEDRIQFAMACKVFNEMVKRAKPKKIIRYLFVFDKLRYSTTMIDETKLLDKSLEEMLESFKKCQIKELIIWTEIKIFNTDEEESHKFLDDFLKICEFVTELYVFGGPNDEFIKFFKKLKHLKSLDFQDNFWLLEHCPYLPKEVFFNFKHYDESFRHFLLKLAEKSQQEPLRFISTNGYVPVDVIQEFLKAAKFRMNANILFIIKRFFKRYELYMTFIGGNSFRVEVFCFSPPKILVNQKLDGEKKRILTLRWMYEKTKSVNSLKAPYPLPFIVKSSSSSNQTIFSGELLTHTDTKFTINDVDQNDWIKVDAGKQGFATYYGNEMLNDCFPKNAAESWTDYYDNINRVLGTKIVVAKPETLAKTIEKIVQKKDWFLETIYWSSAIIVYYCIMKIIGYSFFGYL